MALHTFKIESYEYYHWSSRSQYKSNIVLFGEGEETVAIWFESDPEAELAPARILTPNNYAFYYYQEQMSDIIDMLRNEKPIWVHFNDNGGLNNSRIATSKEPVGEGLED